MRASDLVLNSTLPCGNSGALNQSGTPQLYRSPEDFMFQLSKGEL